MPSSPSYEVYQSIELPHKDVDDTEIPAPVSPSTARTTLVSEKKKIPDKKKRTASNLAGPGKEEIETSPKKKAATPRKTSVKLESKKKQDLEKTEKSTYTTPVFPRRDTAHMKNDERRKVTQNKLL